MPTWAISSFDVTFFEFFFRSCDHRFDCEVDAALEVHRIHAGGDGFGAFLHDRLSENRGSRGAVPGKVG